MCILCIICVKTYASNGTSKAENGIEYGQELLGTAQLIKIRCETKTDKTAAETGRNSVSGHIWTQAALRFSCTCTHL